MITIHIVDISVKNNLCKDLIMGYNSFKIDVNV